jgi:phage tail P2-like protein
MSFATRLLEKMGPWLSGPETGGVTDFGRWLKAAAKPYEQVEAITEEVAEYETPGWVPPYAKLLDPETCPAEYLPWLGQFVGVTVKPGASEAEARAEVLAESGLKRGTLASMETAVQGIAGPTAHVVERTGPSGEPAAYHFLVYVGTGHATTALYEAINAVKPAGLWYTVTEVTNTWLNGVKKHWSEVTVTKASEMIEPNY